MPIPEEFLDNCPLSPRSVNLVLGNLFRKELDGSPIDFFLRRLLIADNEEQLAAYETVKINIRECGGCLWDTPHGNYSIELAFPETYMESLGHDCSKYVFSVAYITDCIGNRELLRLEDYRLGEYDPSEVEDANDVMKGFKKWTDIRFSKRQEGVKLPDFGNPAISSCPSSSGREHFKKKCRTEYSIDEDYAILRYLLRTNSYDKVGGNSMWKEMQREFRSHSYQSLQNRFRRHILPNIDRYKDLSVAERKLFARPQHSFAVNETAEVSELVSRSNMPSTSSVEHRTTRNDTSPGPATVTECDKNPLQIGTSVNEVNLLQTIADADAPSTSEKQSKATNHLIEKTNHSSVLLAKHQEEQSNSSTNPTPHPQLHDDRRILNYIAENKKFREIHGKKLWIDIQNQNFLKATNDWKVVKRRFFERIVKDIDSDKYQLDSDTLIEFRKYCSASPSREVELSSDNDFESSIESIRFSECNSSTPIKHSRQTGTGARSYSSEEDKLILDYIVKTGRFDEVRGKSLWIDVQDKVLQAYSRTWESAKNRYLRTIVKDLTRYRLGEEIVRKIQAGLVAQRRLGGSSRRESSRPTFEQSKSRNDERTRDVQVRKQAELRIVREPVKHPALLPKDMLEVKRQKRKLYSQPPEPFSFEQSPPSTSKTSEYFSRKSSESQLENSSSVPSEQGTNELKTNASSKESRVHSSKQPHSLNDKLNLYSVAKCSVVLTRLTDAEILKYCGQ